MNDFLIPSYMIALFRAAGRIALALCLSSHATFVLGQTPQSGQPQTSAATTGRLLVRQIIGHRGSSADRPENTLASVRRAIESGATAVEIDVRRTKDGQLVLMHDPSVEKTTNGLGKVSELTLDQIRQLDAGSWFSTDKKFAGEKVPTLQEALNVCRGKIDVLLDLKEQGEEYNLAVIQQVKQFGEPTRAIAGVRSLAQTKQFRNQLPEARCLGLIPTQNDIEAFAEAGADTIRLWTHWLSDPNLVPRVRTARAKLHLGVTLGTADEVLPLLKYHPESMSADSPATLIATLAAAKR